MVNPRSKAPVAHVGQTLVAKKEALGRVRKGWWRVHRRLYRLWRGTKTTLRAIGNEMSVAPKRTLFDVVTGLPLALLAWPSFRDWAFRQTWAATAYATLIVARVLLAAWRRGAMKRLALQEAGAALKTHHAGN